MASGHGIERTTTTLDRLQALRDDAPDRAADEWAIALRQKAGIPRVGRRHGRPRRDARRRQDVAPPGKT